MAYYYIQDRPCLQIHSNYLSFLPSKFKFTRKILLSHNFTQKIKHEYGISSFMFCSFVLFYYCRWWLILSYLNTKGKKKYKRFDTSWLAWHLNGVRDAEIKHYHCQEAHPLLAHVRRHLPVTKAVSPCLTIDYHYVLHIPFLQSFDIFKSSVTPLLC